MKNAVKFKANNKQIKRKIHKAPPHCGRFVQNCLSTSLRWHCCFAEKSFPDHWLWTCVCDMFWSLKYERLGYDTQAAAFRTSASFCQSSCILRCMLECFTGIILPSVLLPSTKGKPRKTGLQRRLKPDLHTKAKL